MEIEKYEGKTLNKIHRSIKKNTNGNNQFVYELPPRTSSENNQPILKIAPRT